MSTNSNKVLRVTAKRAASPGGATALAFAFLFFVISSSASCARWANFEYRTFDLAYYIQALWQLVHGRFELSLAGVPLLGNHVEPIVFLMAPLFLLFPHPMMFVLVQNAALAAMAPVGFVTARRIGLSPTPALLLALGLLVTPATGYIALHEFHPEAFTAPCLLLMIYARIRGFLWIHWVAALGLLACKENMALLLAAYGAVHLVVERKRRFSELRAWYVGPLVVSILWFLLCTKVITPALNSGAIDYLALYNRLGSTAGDILVKSVTEPHRIVSALSASLAQGNLVWGLLFPFLGLPLLKPRWLLIATPILLQHLLSWRTSEWQIYFHYGAPLVPLFWIALTESVTGLDRSRPIMGWLRTAIPYFIVAACITGQIYLGPAEAVLSSFTQWSSGKDERERKGAFVDQISPTASVVAPLAYLSHLAMREKLYSLHYILKGLKTLSRDTYDPPPPTDFVLIDYDDSATFDAGAGYYHPAMKTVDGRVVPSSDRLLHDFLRRSSWTVNSSNELTLFRKGNPEHESLVPAASSDVSVEIDPQTRLTSIGKSGDRLNREGTEIRMSWVLQEPRNVFPWMRLKLTHVTDGRTIVIQKGLCAPERATGSYEETWRIVSTSRIPAGDYKAEAIFLDNSKFLWGEKAGAKNSDAPINSIRVPLGELKVASVDRAGN
ncbi:MAG TPA: DUF2079 domain-containing protein [Chthoniobacterales bacterium]|jgi:uncharacterized membrane protein|nr:DUF2079 domain-containing protein [Chthoniobacterales bacterium]